jgi:hypothetical protein
MFLVEFRIWHSLDEPAAGCVANVKSTPLAAPTATARRSTLLRPTVSTGFFDLPLDPDHGKDDHRASRFRVRTIHGRPQPPRSRIRWKFNNGPHAPTFSDGRSVTQFAATAVIKNKRG